MYFGERWDRDAYHLAPQLARKLAGREVEVYYRDLLDPFEPDGRRRAGLCYRRGKAAVIEIRPDLCSRPETMWTVYLHEVAHARLHNFRDVLKVPVVERTRAPTAFEVSCYHAREDQAERLTETWRRYAAKHAQYDLACWHMLALWKWTP